MTLHEKKALRAQKKAEKARRKEESYYLASQWTLMARKLGKHTLARISLVILGIMYFCALFADFIAPSNLTAYNANTADLPPTQIHFVHEGEFIGPFVYHSEWQTMKLSVKEMMQAKKEAKLAKKKARKNKGNETVQDKKIENCAELLNNVYHVHAPAPISKEDRSVNALIKMRKDAARAEKAEKEARAAKRKKK